ncbi:hypothetical protein BS47DRAFT_1330276 [Hydnum rufescens UP504]|uniref:Guided entry of tail-anchored proteins 1 n=1 Tax=Hydnum rufescens UP504 TaxID=1448309 RepID=A0A9P6DVC3_9AGAM|nr:hypothetical protein BS47DRAFT_1330276 [Hydnum rufescens UP504]
MGLLVTIFLLVFFSELISWIGKPLLLDLCFSLYTYVFDPKAATRLKSLKTSILVDQKSLAQTSSQDQFAKWAKLRRKVDKGFADLDKLNAEMASVRSAFAIRFNSILWIVTNGSQLFIGWWYRKQAVFYLPPGWFGPAEWWLALPFAPKGSVSCGAWQVACRRAIRLLEGIVRDFMTDRKWNIFSILLPLS